ncbi:MAG: hypothetical protein ACYDC2_03415, partial [Solirubrobacteraceae bacterium]
KWAPKEEGSSHGSLVFPLTEAGNVAVSGMLQGGPFSAPTAATGGEVFESFAGGSTCGVAEGKKKAKPVKSGTFSGTALEIG